jgi:NAD(P)-dependent dehydrogenase (short-subunit alcohol dehydrogenase family)
MKAMPGSNGCLHGKVAVVTGAARGIGRSTAVAFAREGADVMGLDICAPVDPRSGVTPSTPADLEETGRLVGAVSRRWLGVKADQRDLPALREAAARAEHEFGGIDILFANAGIQSFHPLLEMEDADWRITIDTNLTGTANALRAFAPHLVKRGGGRIIMTSSTQGQHGTKYGAAYAASKWGIIGLMKSAALELGPHRITVNAVIPGLIDTALTRHQERYAQVLEDGGGTPTGSDEQAAKKILAAKTPLGVPWIDPADVAPVVVFRGRAHGFGRRLRRHRRRQRPQYGLIIVHLTTLAAGAHWQSRRQPDGLCPIRSQGQAKYGPLQQASRAAIGLAVGLLELQTTVRVATYSLQALLGRQRREPAWTLVLAAALVFLVV